VPRSLLPTQFILPPKPLIRYPTPLYVDTTTDSLTREKKGKMPALSHLLSVGKGRVLALAACERFVYAGCQSTDNEIVVSRRRSACPR
jgi:di- and tripeptidase